MIVTFSNKSPEAGWQPFTDWLNANGVPADDCRSITVDTETGEATAVLYLGDANGKRQLDTSGKAFLTRDRACVVSLPVPRRAG